MFILYEYFEYEYIEINKLFKRILPLYIKLIRCNKNQIYN